MITVSMVVQGDLDRIPTRVETQHLVDAVRWGAEYIRGVWQSAVSGTTLPGMLKAVNDSDYLRSLGMPTALAKTGPFEFTITADYLAVSRIEHGYGAFDMKPGLLGGRKARLTVDGRRYTIVPFRFGTPTDDGAPRPHFPGEQTMPRAVYQMVRDGTPYPRTGEGQRTKVPLLFSESELGGVNAQAITRGLDAPMFDAYTWQAGLYDAMRRQGAPGQRQYYTFRTVSERRETIRQWVRADGKIMRPTSARGSNPNSWIHPGQAPNPVMQAVVDYTMPTVERFLQNAVAGVNAGLP